MSDDAYKELLERIRDIQEDIKGVPERGIDGVIPKLNQVEKSLKQHHEKIKDLEYFRDSITGFPQKAKKTLYIIGSILGIIMTLSLLWERIVKCVNIHFK